MDSCQARGSRVLILRYRDLTGLKCLSATCCNVTRETAVVAFDFRCYARANSLLADHCSALRGQTEFVTNKKRMRYVADVLIRAWPSHDSDLDGVSNTFHLMAAMLYEADAGSATLRGNEWLAGIRSERSEGMGKDMF